MGMAASAASASFLDNAFRRSAVGTGAQTTGSKRHLSIDKKGEIGQAGQAGIVDRTLGRKVGDFQEKDLHVEFRLAYERMIAMMAILPWAGAAGRALWFSHLDKPSSILRSDKAGLLRSLRARCLDFVAWISLHEQHGFSPYDRSRLDSADHLRGLFAAASPTEETIRHLVDACLAVRSSGEVGIWGAHLAALAQAERQSHRNWNRLVEANEYLVTMRLRHFMRKHGTALPSDARDDLYQAGMMALRHAIVLYDPYRGWKFGTYAVPWIDHGMRRALVGIVSEAETVSLHDAFGCEADGNLRVESVLGEWSSEKEMEDRIDRRWRLGWLHRVVAAWPCEEREILFAGLRNELGALARRRGTTAEDMRRRMDVLVERLAALWRSREAGAEAEAVERSLYGGGIIAKCVRRETVRPTSSPL